LQVRDQTAQKIHWNGTIFDSIREAERTTGMPKTTITRKLNNSLDTNSYRLERTPIKRGKYDFLVHDKVFSSTFDVISAELADTDNQVRERCRSN